MRAVNIKIFGKVQGVFFRESAQGHAYELGLVGLARNEADGSVYIEIEGEEVNVEKFITWCRQGPEHAEIEEVKVSRQPLRDRNGFEIEGS